MLMLDEVLGGPKPTHLDRKLWERLQAAKYKATRFLFSEKASDLAGQLAFTAGDLVMHNRQFAVPPYDVMYLEYDSRAFTKHAPSLHGSYESSDTKVGYLFDHRHAYVFVDGPGINGSNIGKGPALSTLSYQLEAPGGNPGYNTPVELDEFITKGTSNRWATDVGTPVRGSWIKLAAMCATGLEYLRSEDDRLSLEREVSLHWHIPRWNEDRFISYCQDTAGDVRNMWTFLLWLNQPSKIQYQDAPRGVRMLHGRRTPYMQHRIVEIDLGRTKVIRKALEFPVDRASPLNHPVRGAWHHSGGSLEHTHDWPMMPDDKGHFRCPGCGRLRWWVKEHRRGDATKGYSDSQYHVT